MRQKMSEFPNYVKCKIYARSKSVVCPSVELSPSSNKVLWIKKSDQIVSYV